MSAIVASSAKPAEFTRRMITASVMLASVLQTLDNTIANVALPQMQGSLSASQEQMSWVLTSYILAAAIMTPLCGWLASRFGRKRVFLFSVAGFTLASMLCGLSQSLFQVVAFRLLQGLSGAALVPMAQAVLLDINPPERHGKAMAAWGQAVLVGPMLGPILGGWLTENYTWRWAFFINVPLGILAFIGVWLFFPKKETTQRSRFDLFGFALLSIAIGALQLMLDRGPLEDWFSSTEICIEATVAGLCFYLSIVHFATSAHPFIKPSLFRDRNFASGNAIIFVIGVVLFATLSLLPPMLQHLMHYPVYTAGVLTAPRSVGTFLVMAFAGKFIERIDNRLIMAVGLAMTAASLWEMSHFSLHMGGVPIVWTGLLQGVGTGLVFVPLSAMAFATLPPSQRNEGTAIFSLARNLGSSIGISTVQALLTRNTQIMHANLAEHLSPYELATRHPEILTQLQSPAGTAAIDAMVSAQAAMIAYLDDFKLMAYLSLLILPLLLIVRTAKARAVKEPLHVPAE